MTYEFVTKQMDVPDCVRNRPTEISLDRAMIAWLQAGKKDSMVAGMTFDRNTGLVEVSIRQPAESREP